MSKIGKEYIIGKPFTPIVTTLTYDELNNIKENESSIEISNAIIFSVPQDINGYDIENEGSIWLTDNNGYLYSLTSTIKKLTNTDNNNDFNNSNNNTNNNNDSNKLIYYWYVGTEFPSDPLSENENTGNNKWTNLGSSLPTSSIEVAKVDETYAFSTWYIAAPAAANFTLYNATNAASDEVGWDKSSIDINGVNYTLWTSRVQSFQTAEYLHIQDN